MTRSSQGSGPQGAAPEFEHETFVARRTGAPATASIGESLAPDTKAFIEVRGLVAAYEEKIVVEDVSFSVARGEHLSLLGPSGCGKSTTLRCIAGLETPVEGDIVIDGRPVFSSSRRINLPPNKRRLSMVFQSYAIWPHMTVFENAAYGLRALGIRGSELRERVTAALRMVGIADLAERPATELSGGQQQRVALARSYASEPKAILLDEPLSNLDARLRARMREELKELQRQSQLSTIYVTHDQEEAMAMSDRIIVMRQGRIEQSGSPIEIYDRPRSRFVADFIGAANILSGTVVHHDARTETVLQIGAAMLRCDAGPLPSKTAMGEQLVAIRTIYAEISSTQKADSINQWHGRIIKRVLLGDIVEYAIAWPGGDLRVHGFARDGFEVGDDIWLHIPAKRAVLVAADDAEAA